MRYSVVIPAYNAAGFIERCLDSIQQQSHPAHEILVTDDGSQDDTADIVRAFAERHPELSINCVSQANTGIGGARNNALARATGDYVAFVDSDDAWGFEKLARIEAVRAASDADVLYHDTEMVTPDTGKRQRRNHRALPIKGTFRNLLLVGNCLTTSAVTVRRRCIEDVGRFSDDMRFNSAEDYHLWLRLAAAGCTFLHVPEVLGEYWKEESSISSRHEYHLGNGLNVVLSMLDVLVEQERLSQSARAALARELTAGKRYALGRAYQKAGDGRAARDPLAEAVRLKPGLWKAWVAWIFAYFVPSKSW